MAAFATIYAINYYCLLLFIISAVVRAQERKFYTYSALDSNGIRVSFADYKGTVSLVTNVASFCGYTDDHYRQYVNLKQEHGDWLNIFAFPCNQFGEQEPDEVSVVKREMRRKYDVNFDIFEKIEVIGDNVPDVWKYLIEESKTTPQWNFYKYLVNAHGQVIGAWGPRAGVDHIKPYVDEAVKDAKSLHQREEL